ncbi:helix-turn-helix domain-containing protein [Halpernia frigidisoli]|uniref:AraC-type DNA-binding protein n=1 Tax=Halpernia frigidisoli TaxID=1125876 RepID=A0A1I3F1N6_9FLAO|nr:AraC family transcriptional regulator [Halpernia frigidisoli]SFI05156.1 AraC-type DNA-binding protein [Halpernia frigidisoli]
MQTTAIQSCHLGPEISPEQFIPEHFFLYILQGSMKAFDGKNNYSMKPGDYCIARKNHLMRYTKLKDENNSFQKIVITLDEIFLKNYLEKHPISVGVFDNENSFLFVEENVLIKSFIQSLKPYYSGNEQIDQTFADVKREELLLILLKNNPILADAFFNFGIPEKINLEEFMNLNFRFNISLERFVFLTGRSLSSFKRDFQKIFGTNPGIWLKKKRLDEAYFQISNQHEKPGNIYLEVGFEDFSHFSFAFKKEFGLAPTQLAANNLGNR